MTDHTDVSPAKRFKDLHRDGCFIMPNAWNAGSAKILAGMGFEAIATTSAGLALTRGHGDQTADLPLDATLDNIAEISNAVSLPVSADFENGYADNPEGVAANIRQAAASGAVGASIEDHTGDEIRGLYDIVLAAERVAAAVEAASNLIHPFVVTARAECYLVGYENAFEESMKRLKAYADAGAHCVYSPGVRDRDEIRAFCSDAGAPVNVLVGMPGMNATLDEMRDLGVRRLSTGGSLMRATLAPLVQAARDMAEGRFPFPDDAVPEAEVLKLFAGKSA
ncbi:MAG: isocitrate lyase/phosphoenolpyruvate mutase family protein [Rhodospirillales bacterium]